MPGWEKEVDYVGWLDTEAERVCDSDGVRAQGCVKQPHADQHFLGEVGVEFVAVVDWKLTTEGRKL